MEEGVRSSDIRRLEPGFRKKVEELLRELCARGRTPEIFEAWRSYARQRWLYRIGRTCRVGERPVTWTMHSLHMEGRAVDVTCRVHGWKCDKLYEDIAEVAPKLGLRVGAGERCHVEECM